MTEHAFELDEYLWKIGADTDGDSLREAAALVVWLLTEAEGSAPCCPQLDSHHDGD